MQNKNRYYGKNSNDSSDDRLDERECRACIFKLFAKDMINEIIVDDNIWGTMYAVGIPAGGTLTAEWGNGEIERATAEMIMFDRSGLNRKIKYEQQCDNVRLSTDAEQGITAFGLISPWSYGFLHYGKVTIDTSRCPSLQKILCAKVSSLSLSRNKNLRKLGIWYSDIQELDLSNNRSLKTLEIYNCSNIRKLDLTRCPDLRYLDLRSCPSLRTLDLSEESKLDYVSYNYNTAIAGESEDKLLETIARNGGQVAKIYMGD